MEWEEERKTYALPSSWEISNRNSQELFWIVAAGAIYFLPNFHRPSLLGYAGFLTGENLAIELRKSCPFYPLDTEDDPERKVII